MNEDIVAIIMSFGTAIILGLGIPLIVGWNRRRMAALQARHLAAPGDLDARLARIETAVDTLAVELERVAEGQRFVTKLMSEQAARGLGAGATAPVAVPVASAAQATRREGGR
jgi:hypothetical protein